MNNSVNVQYYLSCDIDIYLSLFLSLSLTHTPISLFLLPPLPSFYAGQKKTLEINPRHPLIRELQRRVEKEEQDQTTSDLARVLYEAALLRSGFTLKDSADFAGRIERMLRLSLGVDLSAEVGDLSLFLFFSPSLSLSVPLSLMSYNRIM